MDEGILPTYYPETTSKGTGLAEPPGNEELVELHSHVARGDSLPLTWSQSAGLQLRSSFPFGITSTPGDCVVKRIVYTTLNQCIPILGSGH